jgi:Protein of unknown function (DUF3015)
MRGSLTSGPSGRTGTLVIEVNREVLLKDAARGGGETVEHLSMITGCSDAEAVGAALQQHFTAVFAADERSGDQIAAKLFRTIGQDPALASSRRGVG